MPFISLGILQKEKRSPVIGKIIFYGWDMGYAAMLQTSEIVQRNQDLWNTLDRSEHALETWLFEETLVECGLSITLPMSNFYFNVLKVDVISWPGYCSYYLGRKLNLINWQLLWFLRSCWSVFIEWIYIYYFQANAYEYNGSLDHNLKLRTINFMHSSTILLLDRKTDWNSIFQYIVSIETEI